MLLNCLAVGVGGFFGSVLRYLLSNALPNDAFPWTTLAINIVGSFVLALVVGLVLKGVMPDDQISLMLRVGFCGGFTTLSTFSTETLSLMTNGAYGAAIAYALATVVLCVLAAFAGGWVARA